VGAAAEFRPQTGPYSDPSLATPLHRFSVAVFSFSMIGLLTVVALFLYHEYSGR
jgi:hypothetical protein